jgi:dTDP-4-dehydrorhamnose 3,5-epimerase
VTVPSIDGVRLTPIEPRLDARGSFAELYRQSGFSGAPPVVQANLSRSHAGVVRGMHFHRRQADLWVPIQGAATVGLFDLRRGSPTQRQVAHVSFRADHPVSLYIPPGVAHGFASEDDFAMLYLVDREYTGDDEHGFAWDDPDLGIAWPVEEPVLSERDRSNPSLAAVLEDPPGFNEG